MAALPKTCAGLALALVLAGCTAAEVTQVTEGGTVTGSPSEAWDHSEKPENDHNLEIRVRDSLLSDPRLGPLRPWVRVQNRIVTLSGEVISEQAKAFAEQDARITPGIEGVVNRLSVRPDTVARDARTEHEVKEALAFNANRLGPRVDATVKDGIVTLYGQVDTPSQKRLAETVIAGIRGTTVIRNQITVRSRG